jgi:hypothetical protein
MTANTQEQQLARGSLASFRTFFSSLAPPGLASMQGVYQSAFVGPWWLRAIAGPGLYPIGLGGWWGKQFDGQGQGSNIVRRRGQLTTRLPVTLAEAPSLIDGRPCLAVLYLPESPFPWPWVIDELRLINDGRLLGMTLVTRPPLNRLALPFLLTHRPDHHPI